jgi:hypothetical protein
LLDVIIPKISYSSSAVILPAPVFAIERILEYPADEVVDAGF